ncbi:hypothetical protein BJX99DRAFT_258739 [Aspergillus californicus]
MGSSTSAAKAQQKHQSSFTQPSDKPASSLWGKINDYWILETLSCVASMAALGGIIGFLARFNGQALPDWPYGMSINSVLSWLVQAMTALLLIPISSCLGQAKWLGFRNAERPLTDINMYEFASRGVPGSTALLWQLRCRHWASLGALITVLSIGIGPLVQQMVTFRQALVLSGRLSTVARAKIYHPDSAYLIGTQLPDRMIAAIYSVFFDSNSSSAQTIPYCPTGNCDFPLFRSLSVCSSCVDLTSSLSSSCWLNTCTESNQTYSSTICEHSLPGSLEGEFVLNVTDAASDIVSGRTLVGQSAAYGGSNTLLSNLTSIRIAPGQNITNATASQCTLFWCVNTYAYTERDNIATKEVTNTWYDLSADDEEVLINGTPMDGFQAPAEGNQTGFNFTFSRASTITSWLYDQLQANDTEELNCDSVAFPNSREVSVFHHPMVEYGLPYSFAKLASSMSAAVHAMDNSSLVTGTSYESETLVRVQWAWIVLPTSLVLLSAIYLGLTIHQTRKGDLEAWKSSPTPLLVSVVDRSVQSDIRAANALVPMEHVAGMVKARYHRDEDGADWRLKVL